MVDQIIHTPPYEAAAAFGVPTADTKPTSSTTSSSHAVVPPKQVDTVTLSASAQANQLYLQGDSIAQIAALLGLPTASVDKDLNISQTDSSTASVTGPAGVQTVSAQTLPTATTTATSAPFTGPVQPTSVS